MSVHICGAICGEQLEEIIRRPDGKERFCFRCRTHRPFELVVMAPVKMPYYGPTPSIRCTHCDTIDSDLFPGRERAWED